VCHVLRVQVVDMLIFKGREELEVGRGVLRGGGEIKGGAVPRKGREGKGEEVQAGRGGACGEAECGCGQGRQQGGGATPKNPTTTIAWGGGD